MAINGTYNVEISTPVGKKKIKFVFTTIGETLSGSVINGRYTLPFTTAKVSGDLFEFISEGKGPFGLSKVEAKGIVSGDKISGDMRIKPMGVKTKFEGTREA